MQHDKNNLKLLDGTYQYYANDILIDGNLNVAVNFSNIYLIKVSIKLEMAFPKSHLCESPWRDTWITRVSSMYPQSRNIWSFMEV